MQLILSSTRLSLREKRAWVIKEADTATYIRPIPANRRLLGGYLLGSLYCKLPNSGWFQRGSWSSRILPSGVQALSSTLC